MIQTLQIENIPPNLNKYRNLHFHKLDDEKKEWDRIVNYTVRQQKLKPIKEKAIMTYEFFFKKKVRHDPDNYACCAKFIQDGLVTAGILIDDSFEYVQELRVKQGGYAKHDHILITMETE